MEKATIQTNAVKKVVSGEWPPWYFVGWELERGKLKRLCYVTFKDGKPVVSEEGDVRVEFRLKAK